MIQSFRFGDCYRISELCELFCAFSLSIIWIAENAVVRRRVLRSSLSGKVSIWTSFCRQNSRHTQLHMESFPDKCMRNNAEKIPPFVAKTADAPHTTSPLRFALRSKSHLLCKNPQQSIRQQHENCANHSKKILIFTQIAFVHSSYQLHIIWEVIWMH